MSLSKVVFLLHSLLHLLNQGQSEPVLSISGSPDLYPVVGEAYSFTPTVSNGTPSYTFSLFAGSLPSGLSLNTGTGAITGTPTVSGTFSGLIIRVTDSVSDTADLGPFELAVANPPLSISGTPDTTTNVGSSYSFTPTVTGGATPYVFSLFSGSLPSGLSLNTSTGVISGTPTTIGTSSGITLRVTDDDLSFEDLDIFDIEVEAASNYVQNNVTTSIVPGGTLSSTATINAVDTSRTVVFSYGADTSTNDSTGSLINQFTAVTLGPTSLSNTLRSASLFTGATVRYNFGVVELPASVVQSVQVVTGTLTGTQAAGSVVNISIPTAVAESRSFAIFESFTTEASSSATQAFAQTVVDISSDGTNVELLASSLLNTSTTRDYRVQIVQLQPGVLKNKVDFTIALAPGVGATTGTYSLSSLNAGAGVTDANTLIISRGEIHSTTSSSGTNTIKSSVRRSGNTVTMERGSGAGSIGLTHYLTALEFNSGFISVQNTTLQVASGSTSGAASISSVDLNKTFLIQIGWTYSAAATIEGTYFVKTTFSSPTSIEAIRHTSAALTITTYPQVVTILA